MIGRTVWALPTERGGGTTNEWAGKRGLVEAVDTVLIQRCRNASITWVLVRFDDFPCEAVWFRDFDVVMHG